MEVNKEELRRLAEASVGGVWVKPAAILSLLDQISQAKCEAGHAIDQKNSAYEECKRLRAENERLKQELAARHPFRPAQPVPVLGHTGCVICGAFTDHGGLQCPKLRPSCVSQ